MCRFQCNLYDLAVKSDNICKILIFNHLFLFRQISFLHFVFANCILNLFSFFQCPLMVRRYVLYQRSNGELTDSSNDQQQMETLHLYDLLIK
jgi:hypothetical protein